MKFLRSPVLLRLFLGLGLILVSPLHADLNSDLAFSAFSNVDVNAMDGGKVLQARGPLLDFQRGITAQALYILNASPAQVQNKLATWDPSSHPELKVWIRGTLPPAPKPADFTLLSKVPDNPSVAYLVNATPKLNADSPALQLDKSEVALLAPLLAQKQDDKTLFANFWSQILAGRAATFLSGKGAAMKYAASGGDIPVLDDAKSLLRSDGKVFHDFHPLLANTAIVGSTKLPPASLYYDCFDVEGYGALGTGAIFQAPNGTAIQSLDIEYYVNSGVYTTIELEKIWPITVNGKNESLVWRADLVSTGTIASLHGIDRMAASMLMLQDVKQGVDAFRAEFK